MGNVGFDQIKEHTNIDELTGLLNLTGILRQLQILGEQEGTGDAVIIYLNVMNFKAFNQRYGFAGGNEFLRGVAAEIKGVFYNEIAARTGGDQFIILARSLTDKAIKDKLSVLRYSIIKHEKGLKMRIKAGIYRSDNTEKDPVIMVDRAKMACDDIIKVYDKDDNFYTSEIDKRNELRQYVIDNFESAFREKHFKVYYQPEVRALTGKVCGYEALARWIDPEHGIISPAVFVEVLESVHLIHKLDIYIIDKVCEDIRTDIDYGMAYEPVSVNLSRLDFELCDIFEEINKCRARYDIPVNLLNIEITESAIAAGEKFLGEEIKRFRDAGYQVWMDDFGSGYSSLNNLKIYDFDVLKIDMDFLRTFDTNKRSQVILASIVSMAKELGIHTLAEGVETKEQYDFLKRIGCEKLQGYLFGKPKPMDDFIRPDDFSFDRCEDMRYQKYFSKIGDINVLGSTPLRDKNYDVFNNLPISLVELEGENTISYLYSNMAYIAFLNSIGINDINAAEIRSNKEEITEARKLVDMLKRAEEAEDGRAEVDMVANGNVVNLKTRFVAKEGDKSAFTIVSRNNTAGGAATGLADNIRVATAHVFSQYFRVDLYDEKGTVVNIFLNGNQEPVADVEMDALEAVKIYSDMYLFPEDRERFRKFYDITTVHERVKKIKTDYVVDYYRSAIPGDNGRLQMYMILPFYYNESWKYISCCRYADEISEDLLLGES